MASISYDEIFSTFYSKVSAYDFLDLTETQADEFLCNWLRSVISKPYIRKLFTKVNGVALDNESRTVSYIMNYPIDDVTDSLFLSEVLAYGVLIGWLEPKINELTHIAQAFLSSDEKFFSQSSHLSELRNLRDDTIKTQRSLISERGVTWNSYLDGE